MLTVLLNLFIVTNRIRLATFLQVKVSVVNSAGDRFSWNYATDPFYGNYASDNVCCIFAGFEVVLSVTGTLVDLSVTIMQLEVDLHYAVRSGSFCYNHAVGLFLLQFCS